jgi:hypothetical protein
MWAEPARLMVEPMLRSLCSAAALSACLILPASAAADWEPARTVASGDVFGPSVAFGTRGDLAIAYDVEPAVGDQYRSVLHRSPGLAFGSFGTVDETEVAGDGAGNLVQVGIVAGRVALSVRPPDGTFGPWTPMSTEGEDAQHPVLESSAGGGAILAWSSDGTLRARVRPAGEAWGPISDLAVPGNVASVAVADDGAAIVSGVGFGQTAQRFYRTRQGGPDGAWGPLRALGTGAVHAGIAMTPGGRVAAIWREGDAFRLSQREAGGDALPGATTVLTRPGVVDDAPEMLLWPDGQGVALLQQRAAGNVFHLDALRFGPGWVQTPSAFAPSERIPQRPAGVVDRRGRAWLSWWETRGGVRSLVGSRSPGTEASLDLGTPTVLTAPGEEINSLHAIDADGRGGAAVAWPGDETYPGLRLAEWPGPRVDRPASGGTPSPPAPAPVTTSTPAASTLAPAAPRTPARPRSTTPRRIIAAGVKLVRGRRAIAFRLSAPARVTVRIARCTTRCRTLKTVTIRGRAGVNRVALGRRLSAGRYLVTVAHPAAPKAPLVRTRVRVR